MEEQIEKDRKYRRIYIYIYIIKKKIETDKKDGEIKKKIEKDGKRQKKTVKDRKRYKNIQKDTYFDSIRGEDRNRQKKL